MLVLGWRWYTQATIDEVVGIPLSVGDRARARAAFKHWTANHAESADVEFYRAWLALAEDDVTTAANAINRCHTLGLETNRLETLAAVYASRSGKYAYAEPLLLNAYVKNLEPRSLVAMELARIYLETFRLTTATEPLERWKSLDPTNPQPYIWSNEIASRSESVPQVLIHNYRAALERDPGLDKALLGLAEQLSKDRQFEEADREFQAYLKRKPGDAVALVGLGRNAFQAGDLDSATRYLEAALAANPKNADALKDLALGDMRAGKPAKARDRYKLLVELAPFDLDIRYAYAQSLRLSGDEVHAREQSDIAAKLRADDLRINQIHNEIVAKPNDVNVRFQAAEWMLEHGHDEEGLRWTNEVLRKDPNHSATHRMLANYYAKHGNVGLANYHRLHAGAESTTAGSPGQSSGTSR
jgi:tetratricopeptide (TPR) repeat protein